MGETLEVRRSPTGVLIGATELIHSLDDDGFYFSDVDFQHNRSRVSVEVFKHAEIAKKAWRAGLVEWEEWSPPPSAGHPPDGEPWIKPSPALDKAS